MRQFLAAVFSLVISAAFLSGCGDDSAPPPVPASVTISPASVSIDFGHAQTLSAQVLDASSQAVVSATIQFSSNNPAVTLGTAVSNGGVWVVNACAGTWDAAQINCSPATTSTSAVITATSGSFSASTTVYIHPHVDRVEISPASGNCLSQAGTKQFTATAFSGTTDITSDVGTFIWSTQSTNVATVDGNGLVTAVNPGKTSVHAGTTGTISGSAAFITCPVTSVKIHVKDELTNTSFTIARTESKQLTADVLDSLGAVVTNATLTWISPRPKQNRCN